MVGFCAVLIILNPRSLLIRIECAISLFSALCYAMIPIINRRIGLSLPRRDNSFQGLALDNGLAERKAKAV